MTLKLYYDVMSQPARAVLIFLKATGIQFVDCPVALRKLEHRTEEFERITPFKKVPVIVDGDFTLTESAAILKYLAVKYKVPDHWYPRDIEKQARVDEYLSWQHLGLRSYAAQYFLTRVMVPKISGKPVDEKRLQKLKEELGHALDQMESIFLRSSPYLNGADEITIADLLAAAELEQPIGADLDILADRPVLAAYMKRIKERLDPHYDVAHRFIRKVRENIVQGKL